MPVQRDSRDNLYGNDGKLIGKVDYSGRVTDGIHGRGSINSNDKYVDEYGRDQGWVRSGEVGGGSNSGGSLEGGIAFGCLGLIGSAIMALLDWINADPKRKRIAKRIFWIWLCLTLLTIALPIFGQSFSDLIDVVRGIPFYLFKAIQSIVNFISPLSN